MKGQGVPLIVNERTAAQVTKLKVASGISNWYHHVSRLAPIVMVYLAVALYQIDNQSLWTDEVISLNRTSPSAPIWTRLYSQSPLYFILLSLWSNLIGTTEFALRSFSAVLGVAAVCITYAIGHRLFNRKTAVYAAIFLATSPYLIWYAQEVRYITLMLVISLLMTYLFHRAIFSDLKKWWISYAAASVVALFSFVTTAFLVLAHGVYVLCCASHRPMLRRWLTCQLVTLLVFSIWFGVRSGPKIIAAVAKAPTVSHEQTRSSAVLPLSDLVGAIPYTFFAFSVGFSLGPSVTELHGSRSASTLLSDAQILVPVGIFFATLFVMGLSKLRHRNTVIFIALWLSVPVIGVFMLATTTTLHVYNTRYVAMVLPAYLLILATGIAGCHSPKIRVALLASVLSLNGISLSNYYFDSRYAREDARSAAQYLHLAARPGDTILAVGNATALRYYYKGGLPLFPIDGRTTSSDSAVTENVQALITDHSRLWLVEIRPWEKDPNGRVKAVLQSLARTGEYKAFPGVEIHSYQLDSHS